jgi:hypothetical protein
MEDLARVQVEPAVNETLGSAYPFL